jgi:hypothetical protein
VGKIKNEVWLRFLVEGLGGQLFTEETSGKRVGLGRNMFCVSMKGKL